MSCWRWSGQVPPRRRGERSGSSRRRGKATVLPCSHAGFRQSERNLPGGGGDATLSPCVPRPTRETRTTSPRAFIAASRALVAWTITNVGSTRAVLRHVPPEARPLQPEDSPLGAFLPDRQTSGEIGQTFGEGEQEVASAPFNLAISAHHASWPSPSEFGSPHPDGDLPRGSSTAPWPRRSRKPCLSRAAKRGPRSSTLRSSCHQP